MPTSNSLRLSVAVALGLNAGAALAAPAITSILTSYSALGTPTTLTIAGSGFCTTPTGSCATKPTVSVNGTALTVSAATATSVTASFGAAPPDGDYVLSLTAGTSGSVTYGLTVESLDKGATGPTGATGATGPAGAAGSKGSTGVTGSAGAAGAKGATGATGPAGAAGSKGATGSTGAAGVAGAKGVTGATGPAGAAGSATVSIGTTTTSVAGTNASVTNTGTGTAAILNFVIPQGPAGATGPAGLQGVQGPQGVAGPQGLPGANGINGLNGTNGINGLPGATGPAGAVGATGATGPTGGTGVGLVFKGAWSPSTAYAANDLVALNGSGFIAVNPNTNQNPTADVVGAYWNLLVGQGATGPTGAAGGAGSVGPTGPQGQKGIQGATGTAGPPGPQGLQGTTGANGFNGAPGPQGIPGPQGPTGATGPAGPQGTVGPIGPQGATGAAGSTAYRGIWVPGQSYNVGDIVNVSPTPNPALPSCMYVAYQPTDSATSPYYLSNPQQAGATWTSLSPYCFGPAAVASTAAALVSPQLGNFGNQFQGGTSNAIDFSVTNSGAIPLNFISPPAINAQMRSTFAISGTTCGSTIGVGGSCTVSVVFSPSAAVNYFGSLQLNFAEVSLPTVFLAGAGVSATPGGGAIVTGPIGASEYLLWNGAANVGSFDFGSVAYGSTATAVATVVNNGSVPIVTFYTTGGGQGVFGVSASTCGATTGLDVYTTVLIEAGASCEFLVTFSPNRDGPFNSAFGVNSSGGYGYVTLSATGIGSPPPVFGVSAVSVDFGTISVGTSATQVVFFTNQNSFKWTTYLDPSVTSGPFTVIGDNCLWGLNPGQTCAVTVQYEPRVSGQSTGSLQWSLLLENSTNLQNFSIPLAGSAQ